MGYGGAEGKAGPSFSFFVQGTPLNDPKQKQIPCGNDRQKGKFVTKELVDN